MGRVAVLDRRRAGLRNLDAMGLFEDGSLGIPWSAMGERVICG